VAAQQGRVTKATETSRYPREGADLMQKPRRFAVDWNGEIRSLEIPQSNLVTEITMTDFPPLADPWQSIVNAMESPIGCDPLPEMLKPRSKVALITGDRFTDLMLGVARRSGPETA